MFHVGFFVQIFRAAPSLEVSKLLFVWASKLGFFSSLSRGVGQATLQRKRRSNKKSYHLHVFNKSGSFSWAHHSLQPWCPTGHPPPSPCRVLGRDLRRGGRPFLRILRIQNFVKYFRGSFSFHCDFFSLVPPDHFRGRFRFGT